MKLLFLSLLLLLAWGAEAQSLRFADSYDKAFVEAKESGKLVLLYAYTPCSLCDEMNEKVLNIPEISTFLNEHFILVDMDLDEREGVAFKEKYKVKYCPSFFLFDSQGNLMHKIVGGCSAEELLGKLNRGVDRQANYASVMKRYEAGERSVSLLPEYIFALDDAGEIVTLSGVINDFFRHFTLEDRVTKTAWTMFDFGCGDFRDTVFQDFLKNKDYFVAHVGEEAVVGKIRQIVFPAFLECLQDSVQVEENALLLALIGQAGEPEKELLARLWKLHLQKDYAGIMDVYEKEILALEDIRNRSSYNNFLDPMLKGAGKEIMERRTAYTLKCLASLRAKRSQLLEKQ